MKLSTLMFVPFLITLLSGCDADLKPEGKSSVDNIPVVDAGPNITSQSDEEIALQGLVTDDGIVGLSWQQTSGPAVVLQGTNKGNPTFTAPSTTEIIVLEFQLTANDGRNPAVSDSVTVTINPKLSASVVIAWNRLTLELIKKSERGPTVSSRAAAYMNTALYSAWAALDPKATGWIADEKFSPDWDGENERATLQFVAMNIAAYEVFIELSSGNSTILRQKHLELGTGEDAEVFRATLLAEAARILADSEALAIARLNIDTADSKVRNMQDQARSLAQDILTYAALDGAESLNDYQDPSIEYLPTAWASPRPTIAQRNKINFYNDVEYQDADGVTFPAYEFSDFDPRIAATAVGASWNSEGKLIINAPKEMTVNPAVAAGDVTLTRTWQSLNEWGIFPPADDGGQQVPLSPHWGNVTPFVLPFSAYLRPAQINTPYLNNELNMSFVEEAKQVVAFAAQMEDRAEGGGQKRAISEYWELGDATPYPPGWWLQVSLDLIEASDVPLKDALELSFAVSQGVSDAAIAAWESKYHFNSVRPYTVVNQLFLGSVVPSFRGDVIAGTDDRNVWFPFQLRRNFTPPFPDVPSGHSAFSYAASTILTGFFQSNYFNYQSQPFNSRFDLSDGFDGSSENGNEEAILSWDLMSLAAEEAGLSRLYGGIHMQEGNWLGLKFGVQVGHATKAKVAALFNGTAESSPDGSTDWFDESPKIEFGTMMGDTLLTGTSQAKEIEVYGFYGDDSLEVSTLSENAQIDLYGGLGNDSFSIAGDANVTVKDYQINEPLIIAPSKLSESSIEELTLSYSNNVTNVLAGDTLVLNVDGVWMRDQLNIQLNP